MVYCNMESLKPHYKLKDIKTAFKSVRTLNRTRSSVQGARALGFSDADVIEVVQRLEAKDFHKSMTSHLKTTVWQDVYHTVWKDKSLYVKFTTDTAGDLLLISFKEK